MNKFEFQADSKNKEKNDAQAPAVSVHYENEDLFASVNFDALDTQDPWNN